MLGVWGALAVLGIGLILSFLYTPPAQGQGQYATSQRVFSGIVNEYPVQCNSFLHDENEFIVCAGETGVSVVKNY